MILSGETVVVMSTLSRWDLPVSAQRATFHPDYGGNEISVLIEIDISDPDNLQVGRKLFVDGRYISARMVDDTARIVVSTQPIGLEFVYPANGGLRGEERATEVNRQAIRESTIDNWVPYYIMEDGDGNVIDEGNLVACENAHYPSEFSGFGMLSIVTVDLAGGVDPGSTDRRARRRPDGCTPHPNRSTWHRSAGSHGRRLMTPPPAKPRRPSRRTSTSSTSPTPPSPPTRQAEA